MKRTTRKILITLIVCVLIVSAATMTAVSAAKPANTPVRVIKYPLYAKVGGPSPCGSITLDLVNGHYSWEAKAHPNVWCYVALWVKDATGYHETLVGVGGAYATAGGTVHKTAVLTEGLQAIKNAMASGPYGPEGTWALVLTEQA